MAMETPTLVGNKRDRVGTRYARRLRTTGQLPAVIYGHQQEPVSISVEHRALLTYLHHGKRVFVVKVDGHDETCLIKEIQFDHLGTNLVHVDLARIDLTEEVTVHVAIKFTGTPVGLKTPGASFRMIMDHLTVRCIATDIPSEAILIDVSALEAETYMTAGKVNFPSELKLVDSPDLIICRVAVMAEEVVEAPVPVEGAPIEPEIITARPEKTEEGDEEPEKKE